MDKFENGIYTYVRDVSCADIEKNMHMETQKLVELLQEAATRYFDVYELGLASRGKSHTAILIMDTQLQLEADVKWQELLTIHVWISKIDKLFIYVNYEFCVNKKVIGKAKSRFLLYDIVKKKIRRIDDEILNKIVVIDKKGLNHEEIATKLKLKEENNVFDSVQLLRRYDFDINGHVNNVQYVEIGLSAIPDEIYYKLTQKNVEIQYRKECKNRDRMLCKVYSNKEEEYTYVVMKDVNEETIYAILKVN